MFYECSIESMYNLVDEEGKTELILDAIPDHCKDDKLISKVDFTIKNLFYHK